MSQWRRKFWIAAILTLVAALGSIIFAGRQASSPDVILDEPGEYQIPGIATNAPLEGELVGHAEITDLNGDTISTRNWFSADGRPTLINFWFTTCPPCRREMPTLETAHATFGQDIRFIGVNTQDSASAIRSFTEELGVTYEMVRDPNGDLVVANGISTFPTTLFIDSSGRIVRQVAGELTSEIIESAISDLLETSGQ